MFKNKKTSKRKKLVSMKKKNAKTPESNGSSIAQEHCGAAHDATKKTKPLKKITILRPLCYWLQTRPEGMLSKDRHDQWRKMSAEVKLAALNI